MQFVTNNQPRNVLYGDELTNRERIEFDYMNEHDLSCASFFRYRGNVYSLGDFLACHNFQPDDPLHTWDAYLADTYFSGVCIRLIQDEEQVIVATFFN